jgi:hypothetical protein
MNYKQMLKTAALSTLLLSAVGGPSAMAETADHTNAKPVQMAETVIAKKLLDPLKLAETYAPETVEDWKQTLDAYTSLTPKMLFWAKSADGQPLNIQTVPLSEAVAVEGQFAGKADVSLKELKPLDGNELFKTITVMKKVNDDTFTIERATTDSKSGEAEAGGSSEAAVTVSVTAAPALKVSAEAGDTITDPGAEAIAADTVSFSIASVSVADSTIGASAFAEGWKQLEEAVQSDDGQAIKQALATQLELYKQRITELQEAKANLTTLQAIPAVPSAPAASADKE